jgi:hypothetical protein
LEFGHENRINPLTTINNKKGKTPMKQKIINYIRAGYPGLYLVSHEEQRVSLEMTRIATELKYNLVFWSVVDGLVDTQKGTNNSANAPLEALIAIKDLKEKTLILLRDFHLFLQDPNPNRTIGLKPEVNVACRNLTDRKLRDGTSDIETSAFRLRDSSLTDASPYNRHENFAADELRPPIANVHSHWYPPFRKRVLPSNRVPRRSASLHFPWLSFPSLAKRK